MKKLFQFLGLALIASSMMLTSCTKEEAEDIINMLSVQVNFDGKSYTMTYNKGLFLKEGNWFTGYDRMINFKTAYKMVADGSEIVFENPYLNLYASNVKDNYEIDVEHTEFYFNQAHSNAITEKISDGEVYSDWTIYSITSASTVSFDATTLKFNANLDMQMFNEYGFEFEYEGEDYEAYAQEPGALKRLTVTVNNMTFEKEN
ncbi:MAG: hypothetical protein IJR13_08965 [Bacteroidales bacterium]|nr:hypothetical protein [Bacteroidales bacterium]